jgi:hypothetical protein
MYRHEPFVNRILLVDTRHAQETSALAMCKRAGTSAFLWAAGAKARCAQGAGSPLIADLGLPSVPSLRYLGKIVLTSTTEFALHL